jgi:hypothetical protein
MCINIQDYNESEILRKMLDLVDLGTGRKIDGRVRQLFI